MVSCDGDEDYKDAAKHADIGVILLAEDPDQSESDALAAKARAQYAVGDFNAAKMTFLEAEKCDQLAGRCQHANNVSACMLQLEDYEGVLEQTERVLEVDPCNEKAIYRRWLALKGLGNEVDSASLLSRLGLSDDHGDEINGQAGANRSSVAVDEEKRQEQCDELRKRGNEMMQKDQQENAVELYTEALKENPMDVATSNNRAQAYLNLKRYADAEKDATVVLQAEPTNIKARYRRGRARFNLPQPDKEGGCLDLARVVSENPGQNEAVNLLAEAVEGMDLDIDDSEVFPEKHNSSNMPKEEKAKSNDETSSGDGSSGYEEMAIQDKEVILGPSTGAHPQANKRPGSLMIVEDDECGGCSWCPVVVDDREEDRQAAVDCWKRGEQFRSGKQWGEALELYARGVVANPSNAKCWIGISRVHRELGNYLKSEEAATRAQNTAPTCALLCKAVTHLDKSNQLTQEERVQYVEGIMQKLEGLPVNGTGGNNIEEPEFAEEWGILNGILPLSETEVCR